MRERQSLTALLITFATTVCLAQTAQQTRSVVMQLRLPNGATPELRIADGGVGSVEIADIGKFGFVPRIAADERSVVVEVFDLKATPHRRLGRIEAPVGGGLVRTDTNPQFGIRVVRVAAP